MPGVISKGSHVNGKGGIWPKLLTLTATNSWVDPGSVWVGRGVSEVWFQSRLPLEKIRVLFLAFLEQMWKKLRGGETQVCLITGFWGIRTFLLQYQFSTAWLCCFLLSLVHPEVLFLLNNMAGDSIVDLWSVNVSQRSVPKTLHFTKETAKL